MGFESFGRGKRPGSQAEVTSSEQDLQKHELEALSELQEPLMSAIDQLREEIESGKYTVILGDDSSGRIPTRIVEQVLDNVYAERGIPSPLTRFVAGSSKIEGEEKIESKERLLEEHVARILQESAEKFPDRQTKALVVTESIDYGRALTVLAEAFRASGASFDVLSVGMEAPQVKDLFEKKWNAKIAYGMKGTPKIHRQPTWYKKSGGKHLSGVTKDPADLFAVPLRDANKKFSENDQRKINASRAVARKIGDEILSHHKNKASE